MTNILTKEQFEKEYTWWGYWDVREDYNNYFDLSIKQQYQEYLSRNLWEDKMSYEEYKEIKEQEQVDMIVEERDLEFNF